MTFGFTEKKYKHLAARESLLVEQQFFEDQRARFNQTYQMNGKEIHPTWDKKQGDHSYKKGDYRWADGSYSKCLMAAPDFFLVLLNRATNYLKLREFQKSIDDLDDLEILIMN